ncbi:hypothetical protein V8B97DRAFT_1989741 [Scleroderma yunnanense]
MPKRYVKKSKRPEGIRFCPNCDKALTSKNTLREHLAKRHQWHGDTSHFPVFQFDSWDAVRNHENLRVAKRNNCTGVVQPNPYEYIFNSSDERDGHQTGHLTHYCDSCDWVFYTLEALELHKRDRHNLCLNEKITGQAVAPSPSKSVTSVSLCSSTTSYGNANKYNKTINQTMVRPSSSLSSGLNKLTMLTCETCGESFTMKNKLLRVSPHLGLCCNATGFLNSTDFLVSSHIAQKGLPSMRPILPAMQNGIPIREEFVPTLTVWCLERRRGVAI